MKKGSLDWKVTLKNSLIDSAVLLRSAAVIFAVLSYTACYRVVSHDAPPGQPPLAKLDVGSFKQQFNAAPGVRLLLLLSPT